MQIYKKTLAIAAATVLLASCSPNLQPLKAYRLPDGISKLSCASDVFTIYDGARLITIYPQLGRVTVDSVKVKGGAQ
jgi:hypothetical protein